MRWPWPRRRRRPAPAPATARVYDPDNRPERLGVVGARWSGTSAFPSSPPDTVEPLPNPLDDLPPATRQALGELVGIFRPTRSENSP